MPVYNGDPMTLALKIEAREGKINLNTLRRSGKMPAVYYGRKEKSTPISVSTVDFIKVWQKAGESSVVTLQSPKGELDALIYEVERDPVKGEFRHADFYVFEKGQKIEVKTPLEFIGVAPAVKEQGGVLVKVLHELHIKAAPKDLPHSIPVDISLLVNFESQVLAKDIKLPSGVELVTLPEEVVASVYEPKEEVVEAAPAPDLAAIEVEKKGKEAKEGEAPEGEAAAPAKAEAKK